MWLPLQGGYIFTVCMLLFCLKSNFKNQQLSIDLWYCKVSLYTCKTCPPQRSGFLRMYVMFWNNPTEMVRNKLILTFHVDNIAEHEMRF